MKRIKRTLAMFIALVILGVGIIPNYAVSSNSVMSTENFAKRLLDTMNQTYTDPLQKAVELKMISATDPMLKIKARPVTKEQTAQLIYGALQIQEGIKPDLYYERLLKAYINDLSSIDKTYQRAVFNTIMAGFYEPTSTSPTDKRFLPKKTMTEADVQLILTRLTDKTKRYDPFQYDDYYRKRDFIKTWLNSKKIYVTYKDPKLSTAVKYLPFANGTPAPSKEAVIKELHETEFNYYSMMFMPYYKRDEYVKNAPNSMIESMHHFYASAEKWANVFFNFNYKNAKAYETSVKQYMPSVPEASDIIKNQLSYMSKNKLSMTSFFVTDESLFYYNSWEDFTKGRLYFKISGGKSVPFNIKTDLKYVKVTLKPNTWYYADYDLNTECMTNFDGRDWSWNGDEKGVREYYQISDIYEVREKK